MRVKTGALILGGLLVSLLLAGVVSNFASGSPDGLDSATLEGCTTDADGEITGGDCMAEKAADHDLANGPFADYATAGVGNDFVSTAISGVLGVLVVFAVGAGIFWLIKRRNASTDTR
ncbi:MAG: PDGLE domain-containing protein [Stackebrandtia sp.]